MPEEVLSEEIKDLLLRHIGSVAHLEALLFFRAHPSESWDASSLAQRLYAPETEMLVAVSELHRDGFLTLENGLYRYTPSPEYQAMISALADAYSHHLIAITNLIHDRGRNIKAFSDAFKLRKDR
ncbi:hypothetical protein [Bradyrhizobium sp. 2]|uniref:hypothetical protein n=1 Tax=unclassified Bradyrhizobium TaxID=2631580 RepID=UPI001FFA049C|nr:hypothetical protein [Bradyrhizobium sp. 2]MCK1462965.1 hypothetical protein [Bradyrhizobium sp. 2]